MEMVTNTVTHKERAGVASEKIFNSDIPWLQDGETQVTQTGWTKNQRPRVATGLLQVGDREERIIIKEILFDADQREIIDPRKEFNYLSQLSRMDLPQGVRVPKPYSYQEIHSGNEIDKAAIIMERTPIEAIPSAELMEMSTIPTLTQISNILEIGRLLTEYREVLHNIQLHYTDFKPSQFEIILDPKTNHVKEIWIFDKGSIMNYGDASDGSGSTHGFYPSYYSKESWNQTYGDMLPYAREIGELTEKSLPYLDAKAIVRTMISLGEMLHNSLPAPDNTPSIDQEEVSKLLDSLWEVDKSFILEEIEAEVPNTLY